MTVASGEDLYEIPLDVALKYAELGLRVAPANVEAKHPTIKRWQERATTDPVAINRWWNSIYHANDGVCIVTGKESGVWVYDVDVANGKIGMESHRQHIADNGDLPETWTARTPSGGLHLYFKYPEHGDVRSGGSKGLGPNIDVRGEGNQAIAFPSMRAEGSYVWEPGHAPWDLDLAEAPPSLLEKVLDRSMAPSPVQPSNPDAHIVSDVEKVLGAPSYVEDYNTEHTWSELLTGDGWTLLPPPLYDTSGVEQWVRPGKDPNDGPSASVGYKGKDMLYVFTTSIDWLDAERGYDKFGYMTRRDFGGSFKEAHRHFAAKIAPSQTDEVADEPEPDASRALLHRWKMADLLAEPDDFKWQIRGVLAEPTYGQAAGGPKTLKSHVATFLSVGLAAGVPIFGRFTPPSARPVVAYIGEGGRNPWKRRYRRICAAMGVTPEDLDLHPTFDVAPISSPTFQLSLRRDLDEIQPGLVTLDPWYAYHGSEVRASDLHQEGALLNMMSVPCIDAGASALIVNHMNKTGSGMGLSRITMSGSAEWSDSWLLLAHREDADVENGLFRLTLDVGSRQWGGTTWDLDLDIGRFDPETGTHDGAISWDLNRASGSRAKVEKITAKVARVQKAILDVLADCPWEKTQTGVQEIVRGDRTVFIAAFEGLANSDVIFHDRRGRVEAGITKHRKVWGLTPTPAVENRLGSNEEAV